ncbi:MAG: DNA repair protein RecN [Bacteroidota bacterium]|nr:DNA repair protein RecN [Bacteroidota bacterium]MDP4236888.1 DNA repair protein RecN [Bacteroidota bacterium]
MLRSLFIKNYALIEEITVTFDRGLSIITGETGAGKSILMDAISLLLGERASSDLIRRGQPKAIVEAEFDISSLPEIKNYLESSGIECDSSVLILRRELNQKSAARAFINDSPASISVLKELGSELIDLHGQHEHQSLLRPEKHIDFLDEYAGLAADRKRFQEYFDAFNSLKDERDELLHNREQIARERDFYQFQLNEIKNIDPKRGEDDEIERELSVLENSEELRDLAGGLHEELYAAEDSIHQRLAKAKSSLERLSKIDSSFSDQLREFQSAVASINEISHTLSHYSDRIEFQPQRLEELRSRQLAISRLKKKYGPALDDVLALAEKLQAQLGPDEDIDEKLEAIDKELFSLQTKATDAAQKLSDDRKKSAKKFEKMIIEELVSLGIENGKFKIDIENIETKSSEMTPVAFGAKNYATTRKGFDKVEFFISTNKGEEPKPLVKVASGGEVSRIMLALKTVLSAGDKIPLMIFDEIDSGISGRIAQQVGKAMKSLSQKHQIIAITHLGQIAAFADTHYAVEKSSAGEVTTSVLRKLSKAEHEEEIARLISGSSVTDRSLEAARSLLQEARTLVAA